MKKILGLLLVATTGLVGCQAMGDHFNCLATVNQTVPEQTQQVYVRTETKCKQNFPYNEMICNAVPIYDTVVTNQAQRDAAMDQCKSRVGNQNNNSTYSSGRGSYSQQEAQSMCLQYGNKPNTPSLAKCINNITGVSK